MIETQEPVHPVSAKKSTQQAGSSVEPGSETSWNDGTQEVVIRPMSGWMPVDWRELYAYRELLFFFVWRDITARYKQTVLGSAWAILQPILLMGIFTLIARFAGIPTAEIRGKMLPGAELQVVSWGDGSEVPASGKNMVVVGTDDKGLLHIRSFNADGKLATDTDETKLPANKGEKIADLKQRLASLSPARAPTGAEKAEVLEKLSSLVGQTQVPYPVFVFAGLIAWTVFSQGMPQASLSLLNNQHMMTKVYFPRIFLPITASAVFLVDLVYALGVYALILLWYQFVPAWTIVFLPFLILLTFMATLSIGILLAALTLFYRDFRHIVPFLVQIMMYITPVFYPASIFTDKKPLLGWLLSLNPMFGIVEAYRSLILGTRLNMPCLVISSISASVLLVLGVYYFRSTERRFADFA